MRKVIAGLAVAVALTTGCSAYWQDSGATGASGEADYDGGLGDCLVYDEFGELTPYWRYESFSGEVLKHAAWRACGGRLRVTFRGEPGAGITYCNVPLATLEGLVAAESADAYYYEKIMSEYERCDPA